MDLMFWQPEHLVWYDYLRMTTSLLCLFSMYLLARMAWKRGASYTARLKDFWWVLNAFLLTLFVSSVWNITTNAGLKPQVVLGFVTALVCVRACLRRHDQLLRT